MAPSGEFFSSPLYLHATHEHEVGQRYFREFAFFSLFLSLTVSAFFLSTKHGRLGLLDHAA
jgi:hypothetical protein